MSESFKYLEQTEGSEQIAVDSSSRGKRKFSEHNENKNLNLSGLRIK